MSGVNSELQKVPKGYKQTEVGVIPEEWCVLRFDNVAKLERGKFSARPRNDPKYFGGKIPFIQTGDIARFNGVEVTYSQTLNEEGLKVSRIFPAETLFFTIAANIGDVAIVSFPVACPDSLIAISSNSDINKYWLMQTLKFRKSEFESLATHNAQLNINLEKLNPYLLAVPALKEQTAIANALSDVDALITSLEKLIAKKRVIKTAAMQQLLTGKKRLPPFGTGKHPSGNATNGQSPANPQNNKTTTPGYKQTELGEIPVDWEVAELKNIVESQRLPSGLYKDQKYYGSGTKIIKLGDVFKLDQFNPELTQRTVITAEESRAYKVAIGDIFIALASVKLEGVGKVMVVNLLDELTVYDHNVALIRANNNCCSKYLFYLLRSESVRSQVKMNATQVGTSFLKASTILGFSLLFPTIEEQKAIAEILSDIDSEITALEQRLNKTQQIKQGMMQELLTGKTRLVEREVG